MRKERNFIEKNIELSAEFSRYLFDHPELSSQIPLDSELVLVPEFDDELREFNLSLGNRIETEGGKVTYVVIKNIHPKSYSRLTDVELKRVANR
ncbi:MAG: hypothetical protein J7M30_12870 [Deltaproteobacteria bacterium]|nr:hypothetical protein [Deltaproteobacteria bacterium]